MKFVQIHPGKILLVIAFAVFCAGCNLAPSYHRPAIETPGEFKENTVTNNPDTNVWQRAQPSDDVIRSNWWVTFDDTNLDALEDQIAISNQNVVAAFDDYVVAHEQVKEAQAEYFPTLTANPSVTRAHIYSGGFQLTSPTVTTYDLPLDGSWQPDFWGRVRNTVRSSAATAQASAADLENTKLTAQSELASDYFQLRGQDGLIQLYDDTINAYSNSVQLTTVLFKTGIDSDEDVALAETQLRTTEATATNLRILRAQLEHAIAVLIGRPPESFSIPEMPMKTANPPNIPTGIPSQLLERRPDIASAERAVASANAEIGVARAAFFPNITLSASGAYESPITATLFNGSSRVWSIGASASQPVFNAGLFPAVFQYKAAYNATVAQYRQAVLTAFQSVEDNLSELRILQKEIKQQDAAVQASLNYLNLATYRYKLGIDSYLNVVVAQTSYLNNSQTLVSLYTQQMTDAVLLIEDLGGGWDASDLPKN
jgi:NodT family efflux transporter outer membrane factor (OMF) lipoprotein